MWHDDIFFSKQDLDGSYVKLDLFVEESRFYKSDVLMSNTQLADFLHNNGLSRSFFFCGVNREGQIAGYAGGQMNLYIQTENTYGEIKTGDHLIVYGKIAGYSTNTWDGYNSCGIIPKYISIK